MVQITPRTTTGIAGVPKFFFAVPTALNFLEKNLGSKDMSSAEVAMSVGEVHYIVHSTLHPDQYDYQGKDPDEVIANEGHVIPATNHGMAIRDIEGLKRRSGADTIHQVLLIGPGTAEVIYLHS